MLNAPTIGKVSFETIDSAQISASRSIESIKVKGDLADSIISAGYDLVSDLLTSGGTIGKVSIGGRIENSTIAAGIKPTTGGFFDTDTVQTAQGSIGKVTFGSFRSSNSGQAFGVVAHSDIEQVKVGGTEFMAGDIVDDFLIMKI